MERKIIEKERINRRLFLRLAGGTMGAISLGLLIPDNKVSLASEIMFPEPSCDGGEIKMDKRILVAYASEYGSTAGVAEAIGKELCTKGASVDVRLAKKVTNLSPYRAVIVGSPVYRGKWMPETIKFLKENSEILSKIPVAYFVVCMTMQNPTEENRRKALAYLDPVGHSVPQVKPVKIGLFAGALHYDKLSWLMRKIIKSKGSPEGDFRDWDAIRTWAAHLDEIHGLLNSLRSASPSAA
jgi:menaquinone-dependent protoporphyrinogen oxidase